MKEATLITVNHYGVTASVFLDAPDASPEEIIHAFAGALTAVGFPHIVVAEALNSVSNDLLSQYMKTEKHETDRPTWEA